MFILQDNICAGVVAESRRAGHGSSGGFWERKGEERSTRIFSAEKELRRAQLENESLTTTLNE